MFTFIIPYKCLFYSMQYCTNANARTLEQRNHTHTLFNILKSELSSRIPLLRSAVRFPQECLEQHSRSHAHIHTVDAHIRRILQLLPSRYRHESIRAVLQIVPKTFAFGTQHEDTGMVKQRACGRNSSSRELLWRFGVFALSACCCNRRDSGVYLPASFCRVVYEVGGLWES
jgi:hypothetical protein